MNVNTVIGNAQDSSSILKSGSLISWKLKRGIGGRTRELGHAIIWCRWFRALLLLREDYCGMDLRDSGSLFKKTVVY